jgi:hypothetical protein
MSLVLRIHLSELSNFRIEAFDFLFKLVDILCSLLFCFLDLFILLLLDSIQIKEISSHFSLKDVDVVVQCLL